MRFRPAVLCFIVLFFLTACTIPLRKQFVNDDLFPDSDTLLKRVEPLKTALQIDRSSITRERAFLYLGFEDAAVAKDIGARCDEMPREEIQSVLFPHFEVRGSVAEARDYTEEMSYFTGCALQVKHLEQSGFIGFPKVTLFKRGHDQRLVLIFEERPSDLGVTYGAHAFIEGRARVDEREVLYYWDIGLDALHGMIVGAGKQAGKAFFR